MNKVQHINSQSTKALYMASASFREAEDGGTLTAGESSREMGSSKSLQSPWVKARLRRKMTLPWSMPTDLTHFYDCCLSVKAKLFLLEQWINFQVKIGHVRPFLVGHCMCPCVLLDFLIFKALHKDWDVKKSKYPFKTCEFGAFDGGPVLAQIHWVGGVQSVCGGKHKHKIGIHVRIDLCMAWRASCWYCLHTRFWSTEPQASLFWESWGCQGSRF